MKNVRLSIIIPAYNEINTINEILRQVCQEKHEKEIIIVDDCSSDGTRQVLEGISGQNIRVLFNDKNRGKGFAIRKALELVSGDIVIIQDADLEYYPDEYGILIEKIVEGKADVVYGSRFLGAHRVFNFYHYLGNTVLNLVTNILLDTNLSDLMTCYKAFKGSVVKKIRLESDRFGIETEITAEIFKRGYRVYEVPISYNGRTYEEGKKIRWTDFFRCLYWLFKSILRGIDVAEDTLLKMRVMKNNNRWTYKKIEPFLGKHICELGSGIGTFSNFLIRKDRNVVLTDINEEYADSLKNRFISNPWVKVVVGDVTKIDEVFREEKFDTVVGINVLEHIEDDGAALTRISKVLSPSGSLILIVPAHKALLSVLDKRLGHFRRYSKTELAQKLDEAGYALQKLGYMDFLGAIGWFLEFKVFKRTRIPQLSSVMFDKLIPFVAAAEKYIRFPFGLSLVAVARLK